MYELRLHEVRGWSMSHDYKQLEVWKEAHEFAVRMYGLAATLPKEERYGLASQLKRAATSIPLNIAEGCGRRTTKDFVCFLYRALGSTKETESIIQLIKDLSWLNENEFIMINDKTDKIGKMLSNLIKTQG